MLLGAAVLSFGLFNVHSQSRITEGGILGLTLFLHHWTGISPGIFSFLLDMTCYIIGFRLLGTDFLKNAIFSTCCYALLYRFWEFTTYRCYPRRAVRWHRRRLNRPQRRRFRRR